MQPYQWQIGATPEVDTNGYHPAWQQAMSGMNRLQRLQYLRANNPELGGGNLTPSEPAISQGGYIPPNLHWAQKYNTPDPTQAAPLENPFPLTNDLRGAALGNAQMRGDDGTVKRVLQSLQGTTPEQQINLPFDQRVQDLSYRPKFGVGGAANLDTNSSTLERNLYDDPEFQKLLSTNLGKAKHVYQNIVGRNLDDDIQGHQAITKKKEQFYMGLAETAVKQGLEYDQQKDKFRTWKYLQPDQASMLPGSNPNPVRQRVDATPEEEYAIRNYYERLTGRPLHGVYPKDMSPAGMGVDSRNTIRKSFPGSEKYIETAIEKQREEMAKLTGKDPKDIKLTREQEYQVTMRALQVMGDAESATPIADVQMAAHNAVANIARWFGMSQEVPNVPRAGRGYSDSPRGSKLFR
jgi:hypothetical protein